MRTKAKVTAVPEAGSMDALRAMPGAVLAMPGLVSDRDSTVPARRLEARR